MAKAPKNAQDHCRQTMDQLMLLMRVKLLVRFPFISSRCSTLCPSVHVVLNLFSNVFFLKGAKQSKTEAAVSGANPSEEIQALSKEVPA